MERFRFGAPQCSASFNATDQAGWNLVRLPSVWALELVSLVAGAAIAFAFGWIWVRFAQSGFLAPGSTERAPVIVVLIALLPTHEFVHACAYPGGPLSRGVAWGCHWPGCWTAYHGELTRNRRILAKLLPVIVLSLVPFAVTFATRSVPLWLAMLVLGNMLIASVDLFEAAALFWQTPRRGIVRDSCDGTWWRPA